MNKSTTATSHSQFDESAQKQMKEIFKIDNLQNVKKILLALLIVVLVIVHSFLMEITKLVQNTANNLFYNLQVVWFCLINFHIGFHSFENGIKTFWIFINNSKTVISHLLTSSIWKTLKILLEWNRPYSKVNKSTRQKWQSFLLTSGIVQLLFFYWYGIAKSKFKFVSKGNSNFDCCNNTESIITLNRKWAKIIAIFAFVDLPTFE
jgi:hypothetical protein